LGQTSTGDHPSMSKRLILTSIAISGFALLLYATSLRGSVPVLGTRVAQAGVADHANAQAPSIGESSGATHSMAFAGPEGGVPREVLSLVANLFRLKSAPGFLIGALLLIVATSLRTKVICRSEPEPELRS
jgi:hypothetical protein